jgi:hypothetical protein
MAGAEGEGRWSGAVVGGAVVASVEKKNSQTVSVSVGRWVV